MSDPDSVTIKFAPEHVLPVLNNEKYLTVRYDPEDDFAGVEPGTTLRLADPDGRVFATARCRGIGSCPLEPFVLWSPLGHERYADLDEACETFEGYYDREFDGSEKMSLIWFHIIERGPFKMSTSRKRP